MSSDDVRCLYDTWWSPSVTPAMGKKKNQKPAAPLLHPEAKRSVVALALVAVGLVMIFAFGGLGGRGGDLVAALLIKVLGRGFLVVPVALFIAALSVFTSLHERLYAHTVAGAVLFVFSFEGLLHLLFPEQRGGGYAGFVVAEPFRQIFSFWPTLIIIVTAIVSSLVVAFNIPLRSILAAPHPRRGGRQEIAQEPAFIPERTVESSAAPQALPPAAAAVSQAAPEQPEEPQQAVVSSTPMAPQREKKSREARQIPEYAFPPLDLLDEDSGEPSAGDIKTTAAVIKRALANFGIEVEMGEVNVGPTVTQYTLRPASGIKLSRITALQNDLALALAAHPLRIEAPIPGRSLVGIEIPNRVIMIVRLRNLLSSEEFGKQASTLAITLGRDVAGAPVLADLARMPHLLLAGATGAGKSIGIHTILTTLLFRNAPATLRLILVDPKRVELSVYNDLPHLLSPVIVQPDKTINALRWAVREMERRYELLARHGARDIISFNRGKNGAASTLPYIVVVVDELADIMAAYGREVEGAIVRLAQMARAVGIHLVVSTQRPSVEVITGLIKANITTRIAFQVASQVDSRTILDAAGAEKLLGRGDMLLLSGDASKPRRVQGAFISEKEVERVADFIRDHAGEPLYEEAVTDAKSEGESGEDFDGDPDSDPIFEEARRLVLESGKASATFLQRRLRIGYARAARLLDLLERRGIVGPGEGAKPRQVYGAASGTERDLDDIPIVDET